MIGVKEFQVGNNALYRNRCVEIKSINHVGKILVFERISDLNINLNYKDLKPIDVTEYIVKKIGFCEEYEHFLFVVNGIYISVRKLESGKWACRIETITYNLIGCFQFKFLHQLQNGVRLLAEHDLEIKL